MSENTSTTNVVSGEEKDKKDDKYLRDISESFPKITLCIPNVNNKDFIKVEINDVVSEKVETDRIEVGANAIELAGDVGIPVQVTNDLTKIKTALKARGAKSIADRRARGEEIEAAVLILNPDALTEKDEKPQSKEIDEKE